MQKVEVRVRGQINQDWSDWLGGLTVTHNPQGESILSGPVRDQAELRGMLCRLADLGLELISFNTRQRAVHKFSRIEEVMGRRKESRTNLVLKGKAK